jgi:hypothetical protein
VPGGAPGLQIQWEAWLTRLRWVRFPHAPAKLKKYKSQVLFVVYAFFISFMCFIALP